MKNIAIRVINNRQKRDMNRVICDIHEIINDFIDDEEEIIEVIENISLL